jgi:hypothetical protein
MILTGSLGNNEISAIVPAYQRMLVSPEVRPTEPAYDLMIRGAGLKAKNYNKGFDQFIRKFDPDEEMLATMALFRGRHGGILHPRIPPLLLVGHDRWLDR